MAARMASRGAWAFAIVGVGLAVVSVVGVGAFVLGRSHRVDPAPPVATVSATAKPKPPSLVPSTSASLEAAPDPTPEIPSLLPPPEPRERPPRAIGY